MAIAAHRRSGVVRTLHGLASFVESAYANEGSNFSFNGERLLIKKLQAAGFHVALDVGANFGDWSSEALALWPDCHVHAFEVVPETFQHLSRKVCDSPDRSRITLNGLGLSDEPGVRQMYYFPEHPEMSGDTARFEGFETVAFPAQLVTGDDYCDQQGIHTVDFVKVDVEGAEYRVLKGFAKRLSAQKIQCLQFEYGAFSADTKFLLADYYKLLEDSYWIGKIFPGYVDFRTYHLSMEDFRFGNYCSVSKLRPDLRDLLAR